MTFKKAIFFSSLLFSVLFSVPVFADDEKQEGRDDKKEEHTLPISASFDLTTNYVYRGLSQSNNAPAVQGGFTYTVPNWGVYANIWGSNVYFYDFVGDTATIEVDTAIGISNTIKENFTYDVYLVRYNYPKTVGLAYNEVIASAQWYWLTGQVGLSNDVFNTGGNGTYYNLGIYYDIPPEYILGLNGMNITAYAGRYHLKPEVQILGYHGYNDYFVQLSKTIGSYNLALTFTTTSDKHNYPNPNHPELFDIGDNKLIFTATANIE